LVNLSVFGEPGLFRRFAMALGRRHRCAPVPWRRLALRGEVGARCHRVGAPPLAHAQARLRRNAQRQHFRPTLY